MSATTQPIARGFDLDRALNTLAAWVLALFTIAETFALYWNGAVQTVENASLA